MRIQDDPLRLLATSDKEAESDVQDCVRSLNDEPKTAEEITDMRYLFFISLFLLTSCSTFMEDCFSFYL